METNNRFSKINTKKDVYCVNCGKEGHLFKNCDEPITSYGVVLLNLNLNNNIKDNIINYLTKINKSIDIMDTYEDIGISINDANDIELFCNLKNNIKFLLIKRKHTLGFLEFIRGRYNIENIDGIIFLFKQMIPQEINNIKLLSFDQLWDEVWGDNKNKVSYQNEYIISKEKFNKLKSEDNGFLNLNFYIENVSPNWGDAEWGFPKGRRNFKESNKTCAIREFKEESGFNDNDVIILDNLGEIEEKFIGTNGINYRHVYYLAISITNKNPIVDPNNSSQMNEIGDIGYFSYEDAIKRIRPYHIDRRKIMTHLYIYMINTLIEKIKINNVVPL
jgi:8-oxo-dGTP pyrophosphatase MutT (NUDIX family)